MVNVTSIYNKIQTHIQGKTGKEKLSTISRWLQNEYNIEIIFCKIHGNRWAFITGSDSFISPVHKYQLHKKWGIMTGDTNHISDYEWNTIIATLKDIIIPLSDI